MPGESQRIPESIADPTVLTSDAIHRATAAERDYVDGQLEVLRERLSAIDVATRLLNETVTRVPTDVQREVLHLRELMELHLRERDTAVAAAFAAQKEAATKQDEAGVKAMDSVVKSLDEVKLAVNTIQSARQGGRETVSGFYALAGFVGTIMLVFGGLAAVGAFTR